MHQVWQFKQQIQEADMACNEAVRPQDQTHRQVVAGLEQRIQELEQQISHHGKGKGVSQLSSLIEEDEEEDHAEESVRQPQGTKHH